MPFKIIGATELPSAREKLIALQQGGIPLNPPVRENGRLPDILTVETKPEQDAVAKLAVRLALPQVTIQS